MWVTPETARPHESPFLRGRLGGKDLMLPKCVGLIASSEVHYEDLV